MSLIWVSAAINFSLVFIKPLIELLLSPVPWCVWLTGAVTGALNALRRTKETQGGCLLQTQQGHTGSDVWGGFIVSLFLHRGLHPCCACAARGASLPQRNGKTLSSGCHFAHTHTHARTHTHTHRLQSTNTPCRSARYICQYKRPCEVLLEKKLH